VIVLWRLCVTGSVKDAHEAFSGDGPCAEAKRWTHAGTRVVYCSGSAAVALLEMVAALEERPAPELVAFRAELPADVAAERVDGGALPEDWRASPAPAGLRDIGSSWAARRSSLLLVVPCSIVPVENNVLVNPEHPDFARLVAFGPEPFALDPRLL
jgi:RES domain-containing protein